jgi:hypothetical protein
VDLNTETQASIKYSGRLAKWFGEILDASIPILKAVAWVLGIVFLIPVAVSSYGSLDQGGWITHKHTTPVWVQGDWMTGEYRDCQMRTRAVPANRKELDSLDRLPRLFCAQDANGLFDFQREINHPSHEVSAPPPGSMYLIGVTASDLDHNFHLMPVRYNGRIDRTGKWVIEWRCQRLSASLECKAQD